MSTATSALPDFPKGFKGPTLRPGDEGYDEAKVLWNARHGQQAPALIVQATDAADVVVAVEYANTNDLPIAVRSGGHGIDCFAMPHDALVVDMSRMRRIDVDPAKKTVTIESGVLLGELDAAAQEHKLVVPAGTVTDTGAAGLTLGGGIGHLTRRFGATVDNLLSVDVVTMDGREITASEDENADLFWGLRGAGHNLAIATSFTYRAHEVGPDVVSGVMIYATTDVKTVLGSIDEALAASPLELSVTPAVILAPPLPGLPPEAIGQPALMMLVVYSGKPDTYDDAMTALRKLPAPIADWVAPSTWLQANSIVDMMTPAGRRQHSGAGYLPALSEDIAELALRRIAESPPPGPNGPACALNFPLLGGALQDRPEDATAFSRTGAQWLYEIIGQWDDPADDDTYVGWIDETVKEIATHGSPNGYVNLSVHRGDDWLEGVYGPPEKWQRIVALKKKWDPNNRLRHNKNIGAEQTEGSKR